MVLELCWKVVVYSKAALVSQFSVKWHVIYSKEAGLQPVKWQFTVNQQFTTCKDLTWSYTQIGSLQLVSVNGL